MHFDREGWGIRKNGKPHAKISESVSLAEPGCFHRDGQGGASSQSGVAQKSTLFQYKNVVGYKVIDYFSV